MKRVELQLLKHAVADCSQDVVRPSVASIRLGHTVSTYLLGGMVTENPTECLCRVVGCSEVGVLDYCKCVACI